MPSLSTKHTALRKAAINSNSINSIKGHKHDMSVRNFITYNIEALKISSTSLWRHWILDNPHREKQPFSHVTLLARVDRDPLLGHLPLGHLSQRPLTSNGLYLRLGVVVGIPSILSCVFFLGMQRLVRNWGTWKYFSYLYALPGEANRELSCLRQNPVVVKAR